MSLKSTTYAKLTLEFLNTLDVDINRVIDYEFGVVSFILFNNGYSLSICDFSSIYKMYVDGDRNIHWSFDIEDNVCFKYGEFVDEVMNQLGRRTCNYDIIYIYQSIHDEALIRVYEKRMITLTWYKTKMK